MRVKGNKAERQGIQREGRVKRKQEDKAAAEVIRKNTSKGEQEDNASARVIG